MSVRCAPTATPVRPSRKASLPGQRCRPESALGGAKALEECGGGRRPLRVKALGALSLRRADRVALPSLLPECGGVEGSLIVAEVLKSQRKQTAIIVAHRRITSTIVKAWLTYDPTQGTRRPSRTPVRGPACFLTNPVMITRRARKEEQGRRHSRYGWHGRVYWGAMGGMM